jgi:hypothetical protein
MTPRSANLDDQILLALVTLPGCGLLGNFQVSAMNRFLSLNRPEVADHPPQVCAWMIAILGHHRNFSMLSPILLESKF